MKLFNYSTPCSLQNTHIYGSSNNSTTISLQLTSTYFLRSKKSVDDDSAAAFYAQSLLVTRGRHAISSARCLRNGIPLTNAQPGPGRGSRTLPTVRTSGHVRRAWGWAVGNTLHARPGSAKRRARHTRHTHISITQQRSCRSVSRTGVCTVIAALIGASIHHANCEMT